MMAEHWENMMQTPKHEGNGILESSEHLQAPEALMDALGLDHGLNERKKREGMGLKNVTNRLKLHYREAYSFSLRESDDGNVQVTMIMPLPGCAADPN